MSTAARALAEQYVDQHRRRLTLVLRRSMDAIDWTNAREPRGPRPVCDLVLERLGACQQETVALLVGVATTRGPSGESTVFSAPTLLTMVAEGALQALQACVERQSFGRQGLQQVQVDVAYLNTQLGRYERFRTGGDQPHAPLIGCFRICSLRWRGGGSGSCKLPQRGRRNQCCLTKLL